MARATTRRKEIDHIAATTLDNVRAFERGGPLRNEVRASDVLRSSERAGSTTQGR